MAAPGPSIAEQIFVNVEETLATITTIGGSALTIGTVTRGHLSPLESFGLPFGSILPISDIPEYGMGVLRRVLLFTTRLWIDDTPDLAPTTLQALIADVQKAIEVDGERGGVAEHTLEQGVQFLYTVSTERLAGADISWECPYKTPITDPRTGI